MAENVYILGINMTKFGKHADKDVVDLGAEAGVAAEAVGDVAHLLGADAGVGQREEKQHGLLLAEIVAQLDVLETFGGFRLEGEIGGFGTNGDGHKGGGLRAGLGGRRTVARKPTSRAAAAARATHFRQV